MKKSYLKSFLIAIFTLFVSISCDQQFDTPNRLTADNLLKDKDFLSFISSVEEARYKIVYRQRDLGTFKQVDGSLERIKTWAKSKEAVLQNKELIVKELGFESLSDYEQIESDIQKKRALVIGKYPELLTLTSEVRKDLLVKIVEQWKNLPQIRSSSNDLCTSCFFNNCQYCTYYDNDGESKANGPDPEGLTGSCEKLASCKQNKETIRNASKNLALVVFIQYLIAECGSAAIAAGGFGAAFGPQGAVLVGGLAGAGCALGATLIYGETLRLIEATYRDGIMDCEDKYKC